MIFITLTVDIVFLKTKERQKRQIVFFKIKMYMKIWLGIYKALNLDSKKQQKYT